MMLDSVAGALGLLRDKCASRFVQHGLDSAWPGFSMAWSSALRGGLQMVGLLKHGVGQSLAMALVLALAAQPARAAWKPADYERAQGLREHYRGLVAHLPDKMQWIDGSATFVYRRTVKGGFEFVAVDAEARTARAAFDANRLAAALSLQMGRAIDPLALPFAEPKLNALLSSLEFDDAGKHWSCDLGGYTCKSNPLPQDPPRDPEDEGYDFTPRLEEGDQHAVLSPDGRWQAYVENYNLVLRRVKAEGAQKNTQANAATLAGAATPAAQGTAKAELKEEKIPITIDGSEGDYYSLETIAWSPDSLHLAAYRVRPGYKRLVHYIESSPLDQLQPKASAMVYPKAGDLLALPVPVLVDVEQKTAVAIDRALFPNPYQMGAFEWSKSSRSLQFEYNERGHQRYRLIEVNAATAEPRVVIDEQSKTFISAQPLSRNQFDHGSIYRANLNDGSQILWASEQDGWEHLYLYDARSGQVKHALTEGPWVVRAVDRIDEKTGTVFFEASGRNPGEDPYYVHGYKVQLDGSGLAELTPEPADHTLSWSSDGRYCADLYSRSDLPPVLVLRNADGSARMAIDRADDAPLRAAGWRAPEVFHTAGRDGKTQIWGLVYKPANFDPAKHYPVVEDIYAGPQGSFVPKSFSSRAEALTELGFVVVQIDGMGTNNRSKAFHDVAWRNLKDGGFEDRIVWHKAYAATHPWYDAGRVGLFGTSAGGQNALAGLLFHPEFYKAGVANCGSHDNRMDKIWWNEQWMGWPVGPWYSASSNVDNAGRLEGRLLLVVGEMDKNVDPSTTYQVADRLIKAGKDFELAVVPGGGHGAGGRWGERKMLDFFVRNLQADPTPDWNRQPVQGAAH